MVKIKSFSIGKRTLSGLVVTLPKVWVEDLKLTPGDTIDFYRDEEDRLILIPGTEKELSGPG